MIALIAVCLPIFLIMAGFAVSVAQMELTRTELRTAADAAARAGTRTLSIAQSEAAARTAAKNVALKNLVAGEPLQLDDGDIEIGFSDRPSGVSRFSFASGVAPANSLRVTGSRAQGSLSGSVNLYFGNFLGTSVFEPVQVAVATQIDRDMALVLDQSCSMEGTPWDDLVVAVEAFLDALEETPQDEMVSLETYEHHGHHQHNLAVNYDAIRATLPQIGLTIDDCDDDDDDTAIGEGMQKAMQSLALETRLAAKTIVVLTDGIHNHGIDPVVVAQGAHAAGITVYSITFGSDADQAKMIQVAAAAGGRHWHAATGADLIAVFEEIANTTIPPLITE